MKREAVGTHDATWKTQEVAMRAFALSRLVFALALPALIVGALSLLSSSGCSSGPSNSMQRTTFTQRVAMERATAERESRETQCSESSVFFAVQSAELDVNAQKRLDGVATCLRRARIFAVRITGRADRTGSESYNDRLAWRRAVSVSQFLQRRGVRTVVLAASSGETGAHANHFFYPVDRRADILPLPRDRDV